MGLVLRSSNGSGSRAARGCGHHCATCLAGGRLACSRRYWLRQCLHRACCLRHAADPAKRIRCQCFAVASRALTMASLANVQLAYEPPQALTRHCPCNVGALCTDRGSGQVAQSCGTPVARASRLGGLQRPLIIRCLVNDAVIDARQQTRCSEACSTLALAPARARNFDADAAQKRVSRTE